MRAFYASAISDNIAKTPEGYLIARNVPIARTGWQQYRASEIGLGGNENISVWRAPEEVFASPTVASFEGKSVTDGHPAEFVGPANEGSYGRGHAQHIRRGGALEDTDEALLADLVIKDANLISKIEGGLREISCGYDCEYVPMDDKGAFAQRSIRGNHIAVVSNGRAGSKVCIRDQQPEKTPRRPRTMKDWHDVIYGLGLKAFAKDAEPEEVTKAAEYTKQSEKRTKASNEDAEEPDKEKEKEKESDKKTKDTTDARIARLCDAVEKLVAKKTSEDEEEGEEEKEKEAEDADLIPVETLSAEERPENPIPGADKAKDALLAMKPIIARSKDRAAIDRWNDAWRALSPTRPGNTKDGYRRLLGTKKPDDVRDAEARNAMRTHDKEEDPSADFVAKAALYHRKNPNDVKASKGVN